MRTVREGLAIVLLLAALGAAETHQFAGRIEELDVVGRQLVVEEVLAGGKSHRMAFVVPEDARRTRATGRSRTCG